MLRPALTLLALCCASSVSALSCLPWGPRDAYLTAAAANSEYIIVQGFLRFDERRLPRVNWDRQQETPPETLIPGKLTGKMMTDTGFNGPFSADIDIEVLCFGPWCAKPVDGGDYLTFLERRGDRFVLQMDPCGGFGFASNSRRIQRQILTCHQGGDCPASELPR